MRLREGDIDGALAVAQGLVNDNPEEPFGYTLLAQVLMAQNDLDGAKTNFDLALTKSADYYPAQKGLAKIAELQQNNEAALKIYSEAFAKDPTNETAGYDLITAHLRVPNMQAALAVADQLVVANPASIRAQIMQARLLLEVGDLERAEALVADLTNNAPKLPEVWSLQARVDLASGRRDDARQSLARLHTLIHKAATPNPQLAARAGAMQLALGEFSDARQNLTLAATLDAPPAGALIGLARLDMRDGDLAAAQSHIDRLVSAGVANEELEILKGDMLNAKGATEEALSHFRTMAANGSRAGVLRLANLSAAQGDVAAATDALRSWLDDHPDDQAASFALANILVAGTDQGERDRTV